VTKCAGALSNTGVHFTLRYRFPVFIQRSMFFPLDFLPQVEYNKRWLEAANYFAACFSHSLFKRKKSGKT
jgi:hypothetical protein